MQPTMINDLRYALSPVAFAREVLNIAPDPWQETVMMSPSKRLLLNCSRQSGKSTSSAIIALHQALFFPGSLILLVSPTIRQSGELFKKVQGYYRLVPDRPKLPEDNKLSMMLENGSRIVSLPGTGATIRGFSAPALVVEDEAAQVSDELYQAVRPMLATSNGKMMLLSTPWGKRGHFYEEWVGPNAWDRVKIPARDCLRIDPAFLEEERITHPEWVYKQEYECEFGDVINALFKYDDIMRAVRDDVQPLMIDEHPKEQREMMQDVMLCEPLAVD